MRGYFLVAATGAGVVTAFQLDPDLDRLATRQWIARRFAAQLDSLTDSSAAEEMSFAYLPVFDPLWERTPVDSYGNAVIVSRGTQPSCPEDWEKLTFSELLRIVVRELASA